MSNFMNYDAIKRQILAEKGRFQENILQIPDWTKPLRGSVA
jgi:hypothetical protein